jgi:predicted nucleotidyltransferase
MIEPDPSVALKAIAAELTALGRGFAVVGGFGVSVRGEVRFTRDVDVAVVAADDRDVEALVRELRGRRYDVVALVEHEERRRIATVRLRSPSGITVDLLTASSGIEPEIVARSSAVTIEGIGVVPVARAEELLAMKILSLDERRLQDRIDADKLLDVNVTLDLAGVRANLALIEERGFSRHQNLERKLQEILDARGAV